MSSTSAGTVTRWIVDLRAGDQDAARLLWERYFDQVVRLARCKRRGLPRGDALKDEEDVALSALNCVIHGAARGRYPELDDRSELWRLLAVITARTVLNQARDARRLKRGGGRVHTATAPAAGSGDDEEPSALAGVIGPGPSPELAALMAEEFHLRLEALGDEALRRVALWRLEGYELEEIAARLGCGTRTVKRKLDHIRRVWREASRS